MIIDKIVKMTWNSNNKKYYVNKVRAYHNAAHERHFLK